MGLALDGHRVGAGIGRVLDVTLGWIAAVGASAASNHIASSVTITIAFVACNGWIAVFTNLELFVEVNCPSWLKCRSTTVGIRISLEGASVCSTRPRLSVSFLVFGAGSCFSSHREAGELVTLRSPLIGE